MVLIHQKKRNTYVPVEILLQDQGSRITENKRRRGHKSLLKEIIGAVVRGIVFLRADDAFGLDGCVDLVYLIRKVGCHHKPRLVIRQHRL